MRQWLLLLVVIAALLSSCTKGPEVILEPVVPDIALYHYFSEPLNGGINEMVDVFNSGQKDYRLKAVPLDHEAFKLSFLQNIQAESPPEIYSYWAGAKLGSIVHDLEPIDDLWKANDMDLKFDKSLIESAVLYEGKHYLLPITQHFVVVFYNKEVFERFKLQEPTDWPSFLTVCETLRNNEVVPIGLGAKNRWPAQFWFDYLLLRTAGPEYREALMRGDGSYEDAEVLRVFEILSDMIKKGYFSADAIQQDWFEAPLESFKSGETAMMLMGTWVIGTFAGDDVGFAPDVDYDYFVFPVIDPEQPIVSLGPVDGLVIPKRARHVNGGKAVLAFMADVEAQTAMSVGSGALAPNIQVEEKIYLPIQKRLLKDIQASSHWAFNYDLATTPEVAEIGLDLFVEFWTFPESYPFLLKEAQERIERILNP